MATTKTAPKLWRIREVLLGSMFGAFSAVLLVAAGPLAGPAEPLVLRSVPAWHGTAARSSDAIPHVIIPARAERVRSHKAA